MKFTDLFVKRPVLAIVVNLVILIAEHYLGKPIHGVRKIGPGIYMTNRLDWMTETTFDIAVRYGGGDWDNRIVANETISIEGM